jgi:hypothetical protein
MSIKEDFKDMIVPMGFFILGLPLLMALVLIVVKFLG